jgi:hypothetical protein
VLLEVPMVPLLELRDYRAALGREILKVVTKTPPLMVMATAYALFVVLADYVDHIFQLSIAQAIDLNGIELHEGLGNLRRGSFEGRHRHLSHVPAELKRQSVAERNVENERSIAKLCTRHTRLIEHIVHIIRDLGNSRGCKCSESGPNQERHREGRTPTTRV